MKNKIKRCPFCGWLGTHIDGGYDFYVRAMCHRCKACGPPKDTTINAIEAWNTRKLGRKKR